MIVLRLVCIAVVLCSACAGRAHLDFPTAAPEALGLSPAALARIAPALQAYVDSGKVAGIVAIIARNGQVGYTASVGRMNITSTKRMRDDAVFRIFSMTKPVVTAAVMRLVDQNKLSLDDPVAKYIPAFANVKVFAGGTADAPALSEPDSVMTVRHLLTHTAGLGYGIGSTALDTIYQRAALFDPARTTEQFADSIARLPLYFSPGTQFKYSAAIDVAGRVVEAASGLPLDRFLEAEIFLPLRMRDTSFRLRRDFNGRVPALYARDADGSMRESVGGLGDMYLPSTRFFWGGGGLLSTPSDYLRFAQMLLNGGELDGVRVLSRASVHEIMRDQLPPHLSPLPKGSPVSEGGYTQGLGGVVLIDSAQSELPGSNGIYRWSGYVGTYFWIDPQANLVAMVWTQFSPGRTYPLEQDFQRLVYDALLR